MVTSCHKQLDYGIIWDEQASKVQTTKDGLKVELKWYGDDAFMTATVKDKNGDTLAFISRQSGDDICTVIKYLRNDTGAVRGFLVYPNCYPVAERTGNAKIKEEESRELKDYKKMLWRDFHKGNHPNDIGLALVMDEREDRPYAARYYFRYDNEWGYLRAIYDPLLKKIIKSEEDELHFDVSVKTNELERDSIIGDIHLMFYDYYNIDCGSHSYKTYCGYRPMEEYDFGGHTMIMHRIFRSDRPEPYVTMEMKWDKDGTKYTFSRDYMDHTFATTYSDGVIKKVEEISQWGTVLKQDLYIESKDKKAFICYLKRYNYQEKLLEKVGEKRIDKNIHHMNSDEDCEMVLDGYLQEMWGRFADDNYRNSYLEFEEEEDYE